MFFCNFAELWSIHLMVSIDSENCGFTVLAIYQANLAIKTALALA